MTLDDLLILKLRQRVPTVVCLCGSTRFYDTFREANLRETLAGKIVLSIGCDTKSDGDIAIAGHSINKEALDTLHLFKVDIADEVYVLNCGGYFGQSTQREISYATMLHKPIRWLEDEKFWSQVKLANPDECWLWQGPKTPAGYGMYRNARPDRGKWYAHRYAYERRYGAIPDGLVVLHSCDIPGCVNPAHLSSGTQAENLADALAKGRGFIPSSVGEKNGRAKFSEDNIREIRRRYAEGNVSYTQLAKEFGTSRGHIGYIVRRKLWKNVA